MSPHPYAERLLMGRRRGVLSLTGGGGKTSLMFALAHHLAATGRRVLTTTTTRIRRPTAEQSEVVLVDPTPGRVLARAARLRDAAHVTAAAGVVADGAKLRGYGPDAIEQLRRHGGFDWILVEADGAARRPLKAPADHEPVVPECTDVHVAVVGLEVVGAPLDDELVFRAELASERMGMARGERIGPEALLRLASHPLGLFKGAPPRASRVLFLNKADDAPRRAAAGRLVDLMRGAVPPADLVVVGQLRDGLRIHAMERLEGRT